MRVAAVQSWLLYKENPVTIQERLDPHRGDIITANRQYFKILFSYARYFAVQELATRSVSEHDSGATNRGNWRELMDLSLKLHPDFEKLRQVVIRQFSINTDYLSKTIYNELRDVRQMGTFPDGGRGGGVCESSDVRKFLKK